MNSFVRNAIAPNRKWHPRTEDIWLLERWSSIPRDISDGAAIFGIAEPLRKVPPGALLRDSTLRHGAHTIAMWLRGRSLAELLAAQREYSVVINDRSGPDSRITHELYDGLRIDIIARALQQSGLKVTAFGSTPATLDAHLVLPTDDVDFFGDLAGQWDATQRFVRILDGRITWTNEDPSVEEGNVFKLTVSTWAGQIELYDETTMLAAYGDRDYQGNPFGDALVQRTTIDLGDVTVESLPYKAAQICTACVGGRPKDEMRARFIECQLMAKEMISRQADRRATDFAAPMSSQEVLLPPLR